MITPRSDRTFYEALDRARLAHPVSTQHIGELFLELLVAGIDHELVGSDTWYRRIFEAAPRGPKHSRTR